MATGEQHYQEAERLLTKVAESSLTPAELEKYKVLILGHAALAHADSQKPRG